MVIKIKSPIWEKGLRLHACTYPRISPRPCASASLGPTPYRHRIRPTVHRSNTDADVQFATKPTGGFPMYYDSRRVTRGLPALTQNTTKYISGYEGTWTITYIHVKYCIGRPVVNLTAPMTIHLHFYNSAYYCSIPIIEHCFSMYLAFDLISIILVNASTSTVIQYDFKCKTT